MSTFFRMIFLFFVMTVSVVLIMNSQVMLKIKTKVSKIIAQNMICNTILKRSRNLSILRRMLMTEMAEILFNLRIKSQIKAQRLVVLVRPIRNN